VLEAENFVGLGDSGRCGTPLANEIAKLEMATAINMIARARIRFHDCIAFTFVVGTLMIFVSLIIQFKFDWRNSSRATADNRSGIREQEKNRDKLGQEGAG
jgi:hypothetical protein